jgi:hypothetical protein
LKMPSSLFFGLAVLIFIIHVVAESDLFLSNNDPFSLPSALTDESTSNDLRFLPAEDQSISNDHLLLADNTPAGCSDHNNDKSKSGNSLCPLKTDPIKVPALPNLLNSIDEDDRSTVYHNEGDVLTAGEQFKSYCLAYTTQPTLFTMPVCGSPYWRERDYQGGAFYTKLRQSWLSELDAIPRPTANLFGIDNVFIQLHPVV